MERDTRMAQQIGGYSGAGQDQPAKTEGELVGRVQRLISVHKQISATLDRLEGHLAPVLVSTPPNASEANKAPPREVLSPVGEGLQQSIEFAGALCQRLEVLAMRFRG